MIKSLSFSEGMALIATLYLFGLWICFQFANKELFREIKRYPLFACRDAFVQLHLEKNLPEPVFQRLLQITNSALFLTEKVEMNHLAVGISGASNGIRNDDVTKQMILCAQNNPELKQQIIILFETLLRIAKKNSIRARLKVFFSRRRQNEELLAKTAADYRAIKTFNDEKINVA